MSSTLLSPSAIRTPAVRGAALGRGLTAAVSRNLSLFALCLLAGSASLAAQAGSTLKGFAKVDDYQLEIDGTLDKGAAIYFQQRVPAYLVLPGSSNTPLLLIPRSRAVQSVSLMKVNNGPNGTLDLADDAVFARQGQFEIKGTEILWNSEGKQYRLRDRPPLLGLMASKGLQDYSSKYKTGAEAYTPSDRVLDDLRQEKRDAHLRVYFGSWCPFCQRYLPKLVRIGQELGDAIRIDYYGLPKDIVSDDVAKQMNVNSVPTAVLFVDGKEKGRFERDDWEAPEKGLARLLGR